MKNKILILIVIVLFYAINADSQSLSVYKVDASAFPIIKAKIFALDAAGNQIKNLSPSDFTIFENGQNRVVTNLSCPNPKPPVALSSVLVMDVSGSMQGKGIDIAKAAATAWVELLPMGKSECALTSFSSSNYLNHDFTTNRAKLIESINNLSIQTGTNYDAALINPMAGGLLIAKTGANKKVIVFLSDGAPNFVPDTAKIINFAKANSITIYSVAIGMPAQQCMIDFSIKTGGLYFENIGSKEEAIECYRKILMIAQEIDPCEIEWLSGITCGDGLTNLSINLKTNNTYGYSNYSTPANFVSKLDFSPSTVKFLYALPGIQLDTTITVKARNNSFNVTNITSSNPAFSINPQSFYLNPGESKDLTISYLPLDSGYTFSKFVFENDKCPTVFYAAGGFPGIQPKIRTLKLLSPNGGELYVAGSDTLIMWEGVLPEDKVKLEFSANNGTDWKLITDNAKNLKYKWHVPKIASYKCLVRVSLNWAYEPPCPDIKIGNQIWMGCNLDVDTYRNGERILNARDSAAWANFDDTSRVSCYYDYNPDNGQIYGKLYSWYAVSNPRGLAPAGWHIPTKAEWEELVNYLGGNDVAGGKLKSTGTVETGDGLWNAPNIGATNETGFSALPGGLNNRFGICSSIGYVAYYWSSSYYNMAISSNDATISFWKRDFSNAYSIRCIKDSNWISNKSVTCDTSDAVFSIVIPSAETKDIDMKKCLLGDSKDSLITEFISNTGSYLFQVDSIYFSGVDAGSFQVVSNLPKYKLNSGETKSSELEFTPIRTGIHNAKINIITQSDTLIKNIIGEGVAPQLEVISKLLDFGIVDVGKEKVFRDTMLVKNVSNVPISISNTVMLGPDKKQFDILGGGGAFNLQPNEVGKLSVRFKPIYSGRTSGQIGFEYQGVGAPAIVQLFGTATGKLLVTIKNDSAYAGEVRRLKLVISTANPEEIAPKFSAKIRFQKTILTPIKKSERNIINDSLYMNINGVIGKSSDLAQIPVIAGLGLVEETSLDILEFILFDNSGNKVDFDIETKPGTFKLLGLCREGGTRLFNPTGKVEIMQINPNPASDDIEISFNLIENGNTTLSVFNSNGVKMKEFNLVGETGLKTINLDAREFANGLYFIQLQTPTIITNQKLMILK
ncbi:MAG: FISUMP domain-containing protein [bacterium]